MNVDFKKEFKAFEDGKSLLESEKGRFFPRRAHEEVNTRISDIEKETLTKLEPWKKGESEGIIGKLFSVFKKPKKQTPAASPYVFTALSDNEKKELASKANFHRTCLKVLLIVGGIFAILGILGPFGLFPLLIALSEGAAFATLMGLTAIGSVGAIQLTAANFLVNTKRIREERAKTDPNFKFFIKRLIQNPNKFNFNLTEEQLTSKKIHESYTTWKDAVSKVFKKKRKADLKSEYDLAFEFTNIL